MCVLITTLETATDAKHTYKSQQSTASCFRKGIYASTWIRSDFSTFEKMNNRLTQFRAETLHQNNN